MKESSSEFVLVSSYAHLITKVNSVSSLSVCTFKQIPELLVFDQYSNNSFFAFLLNT